MKPGKGGRKAYLGVIPDKASIIPTSPASQQLPPPTPSFQGTAFNSGQSRAGAEWQGARVKEATEQREVEKATVTRGGCWEPHASLSSICPDSGDEQLGGTGGQSVGT